MTTLVRSPLIDEILDGHRDFARGKRAEYDGYRSHAHRVHNFARALHGRPSPEQDAKLAIAAAFHDLCVFDGLDYLVPSIEAASKWLAEEDRGAWDDDVARIIAFHHKLLPYKGPAAELVEPFRRADLNDFTLGLIGAGVPRTLRREAKRHFPDDAFIPRGVTAALAAWVPRHPLRPAPPFRGASALRRTGRG